MDDVALRRFRETHPRWKHLIHVNTLAGGISLHGSPTHEHNIQWQLKEKGEGGGVIFSN